MASSPPPSTAPRLASPLGLGPSEHAWWLCILTLSLFGWLAQTFIAWRPAVGDSWYAVLGPAGFKLGLFAFGVAVGLLCRALGGAGWRLVAGSTMIFAILMLVWVKINGASINGAERWIILFGHTFQPLEFAKLAVILSAAWLFAPAGNPNREMLEDRLLFICMSSALMLLLVVAQPNISGAALLFGLMFLLAWAGGVSPRLLMVSVLLVGMLGIVYLKKDPERGRRIRAASTAVHTQDMDTKAESYQPEQAQFALARGGWIGAGPGRSEVRRVLPKYESDFVFAVLVEEYGLLGGLGIIAALGAAILACLWFASQTDQRFFQFIMLGIAFHWSLQTLLHLYVNLGGITTGVPLPFFSQGGSAGLVIGMEVALVAIVARHIDRMPRVALNRSATPA